MPRVYERKFDWDQARARHAAGETLKAIAADMGVTPTAILYAVNNNARERMHRYSSEWQRGGTCPDCGGPASRTAGQPQNRCWRCMSIAAATTVRDTTLRCVTCHEWKPDSAFPGDSRRIARRGRHRQCTTCGTIAKRAWRKKAGRW